MKYRIRFNKTKGQPGRGTPDHAWRVFDENDKEMLCKNVVINCVFMNSERDKNGNDWNFVVNAEIEIDRTTSTITFQPIHKDDKPAGS